MAETLGISLGSLLSALVINVGLSDKNETLAIKSLMKDYAYKSWRAVGITASVREPIIVLFILTIFFIQLNYYNENIGNIFVVIILFHRATSSALNIQASWQGVMSMVGSVEMVKDEFELLEQNKHYEGGERIGPIKKCIELRNVSYKYDGQLRDVLEQVNIIVQVN